MAGNGNVPICIWRWEAAAKDGIWVYAGELTSAGPQWKLRPGTHGISHGVRGQVKFWKHVPIEASRFLGQRRA